MRFLPVTNLMRKCDLINKPISLAKFKITSFRKRTLESPSKNLRIGTSGESQPRRNMLLHQAMEKQEGA